MINKLFILLLFLAVCSPASAQEISDLIVGKWDAWIPGAITYLVKADQSADRVYQHGAAMNILAIEANGAYTWGEHSGKLQSVNPWYAEVGRTYYRISDARKNTYDFWYKEETDQLILLFGEVGGHAASATRLGTEAVTTNFPEEEAHQTPPIQFKTGQEVQVEWSGSWHDAKIIDYRDGHYQIHYIGWGDSWNEWVKPARIKEKPVHFPGET